MATTPTSKPVPSEDPRDLLFNAGVLDKFITSLGYFPDRFGNMKPAYGTAIQELGFNAPVAFSSGITADSSRVTVEYSGDRYFARPSAVPFVTTGTFNHAQWSMFDQSFGGSEVVQKADYTLLRAYAGSADTVYVTGFLISARPSGVAGTFIYDPSDTTSTDNGGSIIVGSDGRRWKRQYSSTVDVEAFGAIGDGIANDTVPIQYALDAASLEGFELSFSARTYIVNPLYVKSNTVIRMSPLTVISAAVGYGATDCLLSITNAQNVIIYGNNSLCKMNKVEYVTGEQRHGVIIRSSSAVTIYDLNSNDTGGDGFYVGGTPCSSDVAFYNCSGNNNKRQGLSIVSCDGFTDFCGTWTNTVGTSPESGIDIEPNNSNDVLNNIRILYPRTSGNGGTGILIALLSMSATAAADVSISVVGHRSKNDGLNLPAAFRVVGANLPTWANKISGLITYTDFYHDSPKKSGISVTYWDNAKSPVLLINNGTIKNVGSSSPAANRDKSGINLFGGTGSTLTTFGNVTIDNVTVVDDRGTVGTYTPIFIENSHSAFTNYTVNDVRSSGFTPLSGSDSIQLGVSTDSIISYSRDYRYSFTGSGSVAQLSGRTINFVNASVATLPTAANVIGQQWIFRNQNSVTGQVRPAAGDIILQYGVSVGNDVVLSTNGDRLVLRAVAAGEWQVELATFRLRPLGFSIPPLELFGTTAPTTGTWAVGSRLKQVTPVVGQPKSWVCTVAGTPGTWVSEGNL